MAVINILKDGTIVEDMSKIVVPNHILQEIIDIARTVNEPKNEAACN